MSYLCGLGPGFGAEERPPAIACDGCGERREIPGNPPRWFLDRKPVPGWTLKRTEHADGRVTRIDLCKTCRRCPWTESSPPSTASGGSAAGESERPEKR